MKAAVLYELDTPPRFDDFPEPHPAEGQLVVDVAAAAVHHLDLARTASSFYAGSRPVPSVVGSDGVGRTADGRRVFFEAPVTPFGSWAQRTLVSAASLLEPAEDVDDVTAAALGNTGLAAWLALSWRAQLRPGESVLVLGATGALGSVAVQAAKAQGASRVIAADRDPDRLRRSRERGADATVLLDPGSDSFAALRDVVGAQGVDVIIDPVWGEPALAAMRVAAQGARHVQIGNSAAPTIELPATVIRSAACQILGFSVVRAPLEVRREAYRRLTEHVAAGAISVDAAQVPLADLATAWERQRLGAPTKLVLVP